MGVASLGYSKRQIKNAGKLLREFLPAYRAARELPDGGGVWDRFSLDDIMAALEVVDQFRAAHARLLAKVNANLRYYVRKVGMSEPEVTQRLKRKSTIFDKLQREPTMQLNTMEDIAGVRAVLMNQRQVDEVRRCLEKAPRWNIRHRRHRPAPTRAGGFRGDRRGAETVSDLIAKAFAALGEAPTSRELELVAAALDDEADAFWLAANDRAAFAALAEVALEHGSSGFVALDLVMTITTGSSPRPWAKTLGSGTSASGGDCR